MEGLGESTFTGLDGGGVGESLATGAGMGEVDFGIGDGIANLGVEGSGEGLIVWLLCVGDLLGGVGGATRWGFGDLLISMFGDFLVIGRGGGGARRRYLPCVGVILPSSGYSLSETSDLPVSVGLGLLFIISLVTDGCGLSMTGFVAMVCGLGAVCSP